MELSLKGKTAIVCASSQGLGKAAAVDLAKEGVNLVILEPMVVITLAPKKKRPIEIPNPPQTFTKCSFVKELFILFNQVRVYAN